MEPEYDVKMAIELLESVLERRISTLGLSLILGALAPSLRPSTVAADFVCLDCGSGVFHYIDGVLCCWLCDDPLNR